MDGSIDALVTGLNAVGRGFCSYAAAISLQVGVLTAVLLALDLLLRRRIRATVRYWIWMLVFIKLLLPPGLAVPTGIGYWWGGHVSLSPAISTPTVEENASSPAVPAEAVLQNPVPPPANRGAEISSAVAQPVRPMAAVGEHLTWQTMALLLWASGVLILAGWVMQRLFFVRRLLAQSRPTPEAVLAILDECRRQMGIRRSVGLRLSAAAFSPAVCGLWRSTILLPSMVLERLSPDRLRPVLLHELAHVKRADLWINCLQTALQIVYFYDPLVWLAGAIVRRVREQAVDEMVLVALGAEAGSYGKTLIDIAEMAFLRASSALGLVGVAESKKSLEGRIRHMMTRPIPKSARVGLWGSLIVLVVAAALLPMAQAQRSTPPRPDDHSILLLDDKDPTYKGKDTHDDGPPERVQSIPAVNQRWGPGSPWSRTELESSTELAALGAHLTVEKGPKRKAADHPESAERLANLGKAVLLYANDHDGRLPGTLQEVRSRISKDDDFSWVMDNVAYVGKGIRLYDEPDSPIAYDKTLFREGRGTNVLHLDTTVAFESPERLEELDITTPGKPSPVVRRHSAGQLTLLGYGLFNWAHDHNGRFPDSLDNLRVDPRTPSPDDFLTSRTVAPGAPLYDINRTTLQWLREHVQYVGKGMTTNDPPTRILTYDKTLLAEGGGTNVLHLNTAVTFELPEQLAELGIRGSVQSPQDRPASSAPRTDTSQLLPNLFVMAPDQLRPKTFEAVSAKAGEWTFNKTGRNLSKEACEELFNGTHRRTDHDVLILLFALSCQDRLPAEYEDLLPQPWERIQEQLQQGRTVELSGKARDLNVVVLAAPQVGQLPQVIAASRYLSHPRDLLGHWGQDCDVAIESCRIVLMPDQGTYEAHVSIRNGGRVASPQFVVTFSLGDPQTNRPMIHGAGPIRPGETWNEGSLPLGLKEGVNQIHVALDPAGLLEELDKTNNRVLLTVEVHDGQIVRQTTAPIAARDAEQREGIRAYPVNRSVADFPPTEDLSTPEAAYATINRIDPNDPTAWQRVSVSVLAARLTQEAMGLKSATDPDWTNILARARVFQVIVWDNTRAMVMAELRQTLSSKKIVTLMHVRNLQWEEGRWLNTGDDQFLNVGEAKARIIASVENTDQGSANQ